MRNFEGHGGEKIEQASATMPDDDNERLIEEIHSRAELDAAMKLGIAPLKFASIRQGRACSRARRGPGNISYIVWHTPEGSEAGRSGF